MWFIISCIAYQTCFMFPIIVLNDFRRRWADNEQSFINWAWRNRIILIISDEYLDQTMESWAANQVLLRTVRLAQSIWHKSNLRIANKQRAKKDFEGYFNQHSHMSKASLLLSPQKTPNIDKTN